jgi:hypothetical protein
MSTQEIVKMDSIQSVQELPWLPAEIQRMLWEEAAVVPKAIFLTCSSRPFSNTDGTGGTLTPGSRRVPEMLLTCQESNKVFRLRNKDSLVLVDAKRKADLEASGSPIPVFRHVSLDRDFLVVDNFLQWCRDSCLHIEPTLDMFGHPFLDITLTEPDPVDVPEFEAIRNARRLVIAEEDILPFETSMIYQLELVDVLRNQIPNVREIWVVISGGEHKAIDDAGVVDGQKGEKWRQFQAEFCHVNATLPTAADFRLDDPDNVCDFEPSPGYSCPLCLFRLEFADHLRLMGRNWNPEGDEDEDEDEEMDDEEEQKEGNGKEQENDFDWDIYWHESCYEPGKVNPSISWDSIRSARLPIVRFVKRE